MMILIVTIFIYWRYQSALWYVKLYVMNVCTHTHTHTLHCIISISIVITVAWSIVSQVNVGVM